MNATFSYGNGVLNIPKSVLEALEGAERLFLCALLFIADSPNLSYYDLAQRLRDAKIPCSEEQAKQAMLFWEQKGVLSLGQTAQPQQQEQAKRLNLSSLPRYNGQELSEKLTDQDNRIAMLLSDCEKLANAMFTPAETVRLVGLVDYVGLSCDYVRTLYAYCVEKDKPTVSYVAKTACNLVNQGVKTEAQLENYIRSAKEAQQRIAQKERAQKEREGNIEKASFDVDDFFARALKSSYEKLKKTDQTQKTEELV